MTAPAAFLLCIPGITESSELSLSDNLGIESGVCVWMTETANWLSLSERDFKAC